MIYLRTGANGSCKTLFTLADVRKLQIESGRPVCVNGRFKLKPEKMLEFGWKVIEFKDWEAQDDGTIFLIDECHNDLPVRPNGSEVPRPVRMLAEHRARGFDFFLLTQHPMNIDSFVRKLIGAPGWHQHLKRRFGGSDTTSVLQWDAVRVDCEKDGSGKSAQVVARKQPKEVYTWYDSASLHTAKVRIPKQVFILGALVVIVPLLAWFGLSKLRGITHKPDAPAAAAPGQLANVPFMPGQGAPGEKRVMSQSEYLASYGERLQGFAYSAPRYDEVTKPTTAPYPAACVKMGSKCGCYSQQATRLPVPEAICLQIVQTGFFLDWQAGANPGSQAAPAQSPMPSTAPRGQSAATAVPVAMSAGEASGLSSVAGFSSTFADASAADSALKPEPTMQREHSAVTHRSYFVQ